MSWQNCVVPEGISIECPHCTVLSTMKLIPSSLDTDLKFVAGRLTCSDCTAPIKVWLLDGDFLTSSGIYNNWKEAWVSPPLKDKAAEAPTEVDEDLKKDYREASLTLEISPRASAALSRYCLQKLLRTKAGVKAGNLKNEIQEVIDSRSLPTYLNEAIDAIRNIGNLAAHPSEDKQTGELIEVEREEAEWLIEILDALFDFYFVQPAKLAKRKTALNVKLEATGKPLMK